MIVHRRVVEKHLAEELPFLATEHILMEAVKRGKDRQIVHERLRVHSFEASRLIKEEGKPCDLFERISQDPAIGLSRDEIQNIGQTRHFLGRAIEQTHDFLNEEVSPILKKFHEIAPYSAVVEL